MRLIDADEIQEGFVRGAMINYIVGVEGEIDQVEGAVTAFNQILDAQPTVDQWHYPSKGEYPSLLEYVLCKLTDDTYEVGYYQGQIDGEPEWAFTCFLGDVVAWQYIEPPKEEV